MNVNDAIAGYLGNPILRLCQYQVDETTLTITCTTAMTPYVEDALMLLFRLAKSLGLYWVTLQTTDDGRVDQMEVDIAIRWHELIAGQS